MPQSGAFHETYHLTDSGIGVRCGVCRAEGRFGQRQADRPNRMRGRQLAAHPQAHQEDDGDRHLQSPLGQRRRTRPGNSLRRRLRPVVSGGQRQGLGHGRSGVFPRATAPDDEQRVLDPVLRVLLAQEVQQNGHDGAGGQADGGPDERGGHSRQA